MKRQKKLVLLGLLTAQALALFVVEMYIPLPIHIPGIKLGLANIISIVALILFGYREAIAIVVLRTLLGSLFAGNFSVFFFSIAGGILSASAMAILFRYLGTHFSIYSISVVGAVFHNIGQLLVAAAIISNFYIFAYLPPLLISGVVTGYFIGWTAKFLLEILRKHGKTLGIEAFNYDLK
ncbi:Heptaprenyl diphosphate synthase component I [Alkaliphilus metalliredigens QYMF]|uniref:Heptaprenyl diphosphate synthase component I n=1 Tax=Alkaliphilus metalliredigens (strain QYMF) TaxID=293826 RepID=A6TW38_ALKMQ|nr:Gx transporter family protein [Alkaliphilus metalliredigens]ABR50406.1 Heptaprenyl diphosphate synthase component I [Alkaliphilus metalliredigens QYMF]